MTFWLWLLTIAQITCFQCCAWPSMVRMIRRGSSEDLSVWREWLILTGASLQLALMWLTHASWFVRLSPIASSLNVLGLLLVIRRYRQ